MTVKSFFDGRVIMHPGDCMDIVKTLPDNSIDSVCTDPPYALVSITKRFAGTSLDGSGTNEARARAGADGYARFSKGFMGKDWDNGTTAFAVEFWSEILRVLKPGGFVAAFGGTRTYHKLACAIEDAGFEIRDQVEFDHESDGDKIAFIDSLNEEQRSQFFKLFGENGPGRASWKFGSGFPKSLSISKAVDKYLGFERDKILIDASKVRNPKTTGGGKDGTEGASRPFIVKARESGFHEAVSDEAVSDEAVSDEAVSFQGWGTALKPSVEPIVLARKPLSEKSVAANVLRWGTGGLNIDGCRIETEEKWNGRDLPNASNGVTWGGMLNASSSSSHPLGRWPANTCHDGSSEVLDAFPDSESSRSEITSKPGAVYGNGSGLPSYTGTYGFNDSGSAARFFYSSKADSDSRLASKHPTVKPVDLIRWLVRLITPIGGTSLDCFAGTGTLGEAAYYEGFNAILIEREAEYQADIARRMDHIMKSPRERSETIVKGKKQVQSAGPLFCDDVTQNGGGKYNGHASKFYVGPPEQYGGGGGRSTENSLGTDNRANRSQKVRIDP